MGLGNCRLKTVGGLGAAQGLGVGLGWVATGWEPSSTVDGRLGVVARGWAVGATMGWALEIGLGLGVELGGTGAWGRTKLPTGGGTWGGWASASRLRLFRGVVGEDGVAGVVLTCGETAAAVASLANGVGRG